MYTQTAVDTLLGRIAFDVSDLIIVSPDNLVGAALKTFRYYHQLATVKNLFYTVEESVANDVAEFNQFLTELKLNSVLAALTQIIDLNPKHEIDLDYTSLILKNVAIFDDAIGYLTAEAMLEVMISTSRNNAVERNASLKYDKLKIALEGLSSEDGKILATGINLNIRKSVLKAQNVIFKTTATVTSAQIW